MAKEDRGFASMDRAKQREIASKGGKAAHQKGTAHEWTSEEARDAGRKGGIASHQRRREQMTGSEQPQRRRCRFDVVAGLDGEHVYGEDRVARTTKDCVIGGTKERTASGERACRAVPIRPFAARICPARSYHLSTRLPRHSGPSITKRHSGFCRSSRSARQI